MTTDEAMEIAKAAAEGGSGTALFERLVERLGGKAHVSAVFGDPIERNGITVIPVARLRWFFGAGSGSGPAAEAEGDGSTSSGSGGGGGGGAEPLGYVEIGPEGATFRPIEDANRMPSPGLVLVAGISAALVLRALARLLRG